MRNPAAVGLTTPEPLATLTSGRLDTRIETTASKEQPPMNPNYRSPPDPTYPNGTIAALAISINPSSGLG